MSDYVESAADHQFTAFLAHLTPGKVLRDREANFSKQERKRQIFLRQKSTTERKARVRFMFTDEQINLAQRVLAEQNKGDK